MLVLAAIGLAITFGVMGVINMAHGELMMLGAYTTWVVQQLMPNAIGASLFVAMPVAFLIAALVGIAIERGVVRFLYGRPLETLLATFGVSLVLQQAVRSIFSPLNRAVTTPEWMSGSARDHPGLAITLQPALHHRLQPARVPRAARRPALHDARAADARGRAEPRHGARDGRPRRLESTR